MKLNGPDKYHLTITDQSASVRSPDGTPHFVAPATVSGKSKIYVVSKASILLYVGVTNQPMSARLRGGLMADGTHGYHGYKWGRENHDIHLDIWYLEGDDIKSTDLETIEAEVVFLYRKESGHWPQAQTEIHFHPSGKSHREHARQIVQAFMEK